MAEEVDSRNAAFKRFRDTDQDDSSDSMDGSYHKRQRVSAHLPNPEGLPTILLSDDLQEDNAFAATSHGQSSLPRLNWNTGTKTTIGTSLKDRKRANNAHNSGTAARHSDASK